METKNQNQSQPAEGRMMIDFPLVEELIQEAMRRRTLKASFRLNLSTQAALNLLAEHYARVVIERHQETKFDEYIQQNLYELAKCLTAEVPKSGVMLCGNCGNGKTTMLQALHNALLALGDNHFSFVRMDFNANMKIFDARDIVLLGKDFNEIRKIRERDLLAIDDFGKEPVEVMDYGTVLSPLVHLLEFRYGQQLFTAITTNLTPPEVREKYGARIADRFNEMMYVIPFYGPSYRE